MPRSTVRVVRAPPGLVWCAFDADQAIGAARAFLRPDDRWFIVFDTCRADCYQPLLAAVAENVGGDLYTTARDTDGRGLDRLTRLGFSVNRRESSYLIPTDPAATGLDAVHEHGDVVIISAADADEEQLRALDDALPQDVPGTAGWKWDPGVRPRDVPGRRRHEQLRLRRAGPRLERPGKASAGPGRRLPPVPPARAGQRAAGPRVPRPARAGPDRGHRRGR